MYNKTGQKIKSFASGMAIFEIIVSEIVAIIFFVLFYENAVAVPVAESKFEEKSLLLFLLISLIFGLVLPFLSWQKYLFIAGFGELIENTHETKNELADIKTILISTLNYDASNLNEEENSENVELSIKHIKILSNMHDKGELTDDEFNQLLNEIQNKEV